MSIVLFSRFFVSAYGRTYAAEVVHERGVLVAQLVFIRPHAEPNWVFYLPDARPYRVFYATGEEARARRNVLAAARRRGFVCPSN